MEKKVYISPSVVTVQLNVRDGIFMTASDGSNNILRNGGETTGDIVSDTKYEDDYDLWEE